jgi:hypothetical protein
MLFILILQLALPDCTVEIAGEAVSEDNVRAAL